MEASRLEQLPRDLLALIFNELSWTSLANVTFTSTVFIDAAFDSAASRPEREVVEEEQQPEAPAEPEEPAAENNTGQDPIEVIEILEGSQEPESRVQEVAPLSLKRKLDDNDTSYGEVVRVVHQRQLVGSPTTQNKRRRTPSSGQYVNFSVQMIQPPQIVRHNVTTNMPAALPLAYAQPQLHSMFFGPQVVPYQPHPQHASCIVPTAQHQQPVIFPNYGFQHQAPMWTNAAGPMMAPQIDHGRQEQTMMQQQLMYAQPMQWQAQPQRHNGWGGSPTGQW